MIKEKLNDLKLSVNKKSNIYRSSVGFSFLGYRYQTVNCRLNILLNAKTFRKIKKK